MKLEFSGSILGRWIRRKPGPSQGIRNSLSWAAKPANFKGARGACGAHWTLFGASKKTVAKTSMRNSGAQAAGAFSIDLSSARDDEPESLSENGPGRVSEAGAAGRR